MDYQTVFEFFELGLQQAVLGPLNRNLIILEEELGFPINFHNGKVLVESSIETTPLHNILTICELFFKKGLSFKERDLISLITMVKTYPFDEVLAFYQKKPLILTTYEGKALYAKTINQKRYLELLAANDIIFATGAAGTGKTWVAVGFAVNALKQNQIRRIIITRPAVEAGEKLGFLPGDLKEKVDPYLIPIYDAIFEFLGKQQAEKLIEKGTIEIAPLAYMRGRTLDNALIIMDEAQNTTRSQMKMALTRLGFSSKMVITGDITQIDLPQPHLSGLLEAIGILKELPQIGMIHFEKTDVMRHPIVSKIIAKYEELER